MKKIVCIKEYQIIRILCDKKYEPLPPKTKKKRKKDLNRTSVKFKINEDDCICRL